MNPHFRPRTREAQNQPQIDSYLDKGASTLGPWTTHIYRSDPRHLLFLLARYKFCAKMLAGKERVLEVGCGDGFGLPVVRQTTGSIHAVDFEPLVVEDARKRFAVEEIDRVDFQVHDITEAPPAGRFDAAYTLDVIEHIPSEKEDRFMENICAVLDRNGVLIVGTPNRDAERHASEASRQGHVNLKRAGDLHRLLGRYFHNVFSFSMNDEMVHTGFSPMAHYLLCMGVGRIMPAGTV